MRSLVRSILFLSAVTLGCAAGEADSVDPSRWVEELSLADAGIYDVEGDAQSGYWLASRGLYRRVDARWELIPSTDGRTWRSLSLTAEGELWAVGLGGVARLPRGASVEALTIQEDVRGLHHVSAHPGRVWASASDEQIWTWDGSAWTTLKPQELAGHYVGGLFAPSAQQLFVHAPWTSTGKPLTLGRYDGQRWTVDTLGKGWRYSAALDGTAADDVWSVGTRGKLFGKGGFAVHFDGKSWVETTLPVDVPLADVSARARDDVWACGRKGTLLRWDGRAWEALDSGLSGSLTRIYAAPDGPVWVVLNDSRLLRWTGETP